MTKQTEPTALTQPSFDKMTSEFRFAMYGCAVFLLLACFGMFVPAVYQDWQGLVSVANQFGMLLCVVFGSMVAFRIYAKHQAFVAAFAMLSPWMFTAGGLPEFFSVLAYLLVMNSAAKLIRRRGNHVGLTGSVTKFAQQPAAKHDALA